MAIQHAIPMKHDDAWPLGCFIVGEVEPMKDFKRSTRETAVQAVDPETELPIWRVEVVDADPQARDKTVRVKLLSTVRPVPPEAAPGVPFRPVVFEGLRVKAWVNSDRCKVEDGKAHRCGGQVAWSYTATGMRAPQAGVKARVGANGRAAE